MVSFIITFDNPLSEFLLPIFGMVRSMVLLAFLPKGEMLPRVATALVPSTWKLEDYLLANWRKKEFRLARVTDPDYQDKLCCHEVPLRLPLSSGKS